MSEDSTSNNNNNELVGTPEQLTLGKAFKRSVVPHGKFKKNHNKSSSKVDIKQSIALDGFVQGQSLDDYGGDGA